MAHRPPADPALLHKHTLRIGRDSFGVLRSPCHPDRRSLVSARWSHVEQR